MKKVALLSLPFEPNYGWILQLWALYSFLEKNGYEVTVIDRRWNDNNPSIIKTIIRFCYYYLFAHSFTSFFNDRMNVSPTFRNSSALREYILGEQFSTIVVGSDQVWRIENTRGVDLNFFLDFAEGMHIGRVAYAASFGKDVWKGDPKETLRVGELLKGFDLVSVRESSGVNICRDYFDIEAQHVLDPTLLLNQWDYTRLFNKRKPRSGDFIATYLLDYSQKKQFIVDSVQHRFGIVDVVGLFPHRRSRFSVYRSIEEWLMSISEASYVIIDSFHGMVFSIIFHKQFVVIGNIKRGITRFTSLLDSLGLSERLVSDDSDVSLVYTLLSNPIDYCTIDSKLSSLRIKSSELLINSIGLDGT